MSASFRSSRRSQLAGYAGTAGGILRSRIHPLVPVAAIDLLAVVVALGALTLVGTIVGGQRANPSLSAIDQTKDDLTTPLAVMPVIEAPAAQLAKAPDATPHPSRSPRKAGQPIPRIAVLATMPDAELLFGEPVFIGGPFESNQGDTMRFICPVDNDRPPHCVIWPPAEESPPADVAVIEEPLYPEATDDDPPSRPVATQTRVLPRAGEEEAAATAAAAVVQTGAAARGPAVAAVQSVAPPVAQAAAPAVQAAAPVAQAAAPVVQSAAPVVQSVTPPVTQVGGAVSGLLN